VVRRFQREGDDHFITFSCYRREPYFPPQTAIESAYNSRP
jgi:hypothetical protein